MNRVERYPDCILPNFNPDLVLGRPSRVCSSALTVSRGGMGQCWLRRWRALLPLSYQSAEAMRSVWAIGPTSWTRTMAALA